MSYTDIAIDAAANAEFSKHYGPGYVSSYRAPETKNQEGEKAMCISLLVITIFAVAVFGNPPLAGKEVVIFSIGYYLFDIKWKYEFLSVLLVFGITIYNVCALFLQYIQYVSR